MRQCIAVSSFISVIDVITRMITVPITWDGSHQYVGIIIIGTKTNTKPDPPPAIHEPIILAKTPIQASSFVQLS